MKQGIHPDYVPTTVTCTCGNTFETRSTVTSGEIRVDVCSSCHPFYTGKQKILDTGGRVPRGRGSHRSAHHAPSSRLRREPRGRRAPDPPVVIGPGRTNTVLPGPMALRSEVCGLTDGVVVSRRFAVA